MTAPLLLSIDTASARGIVVLSRGDEVLAASTYLAGSDHAEKLLDHVRDVLRRGDVSLDHVEAFGLGLGPGSFTGVRVGVATVKAFVLAFPRPVAAVSTLAVLVEQAVAAAPDASTAPLGVLLSAGREDAFVGIFPPAQIAERARLSPRVEVVTHAALPAFFAENGLLGVVGANASRLLPTIADYTTHDGLPTAEALARLASRAPLLGGQAVIDLEPAYARPPQITTSRARLPSV